MTTSARHETAKIYAFPPRGRLAEGRDVTAKASGAQPSHRAPEIDFGSWYHQAAVQEDQRTRKP